MKKQFPLSVVLILLCVLPLVQCTKEGTLFNSTEEKILGMWRFEQVTFFPYLSISGDDLTHEYMHKVLDFRKEQEVLKSDTETGDEWTGTWRTMHYVTYDVDYSGSTSERLDATLIHNQTQEIFSLTLDHLHVTRKKVRSTVYFDDGRIEYRLARP